MGSAISPFFFCLAIDPLIRRINSFRNVIVMRAYMDDNSAMLKHAKSVDRIATLFEDYISVGIHVLPHSCCFFAPHGIPFPETVSALANSQGKGGASWRRAALAALSQHPGANQFVALGSKRVFGKNAIHRIAHGREIRIVMSLLQVE